MDTIGLLGAWVAVISFLLAALIAMGLNALSALSRRWRAHGEPTHKLTPETSHVATLVSLYGSLILTLVAAVGLMVVSIEILDIGPALLATTLPFNINTKILTRSIGLLTVVLSYCFIFRLSYLGIKLRSTLASKE
jgi:hypothetical protein